MVMTPQLLQSIRLLQFTQLELDRFVQDQIESNPLLEQRRLKPVARGCFRAGKDRKPTAGRVVDGRTRGQLLRNRRQARHDLSTTSFRMIPEWAGTDGDRVSLAPGASRRHRIRPFDFDLESLISPRSLRRDRLRDHLIEQISLTVRTRSAAPSPMNWSMRSIPTVMSIIRQRYRDAARLRAARMSPCWANCRGWTRRVFLPAISASVSPAAAPQ
jgi:DNA-directed RNA polymerase specialized sigma54-like protein